ncbi:MAG: hypothetical protein IPL55_09490 [Saprospiraceae bacterium]|nr:hypothetical protein [Saprospiraceae bacterium]MBL0027004.1 hypothetical protein [Saprospiraceae bacterium]
MMRICIGDKKCKKNSDISSTHIIFISLKGNIPLTAGHVRVRPREGNHRK